MYTLLLIAFLGGVALAMQTAVNSQLAVNVGGYVLVAAFVSFCSGAMIFTALGLVSGQLQTALSLALQQPLWRLSGGLLGAIAFIGFTYVAPRLGLTAVLALVIAGQLLASITIDQFGWLGMAMRPVSPVRLVGAAVMASGVGLILFGDRLLHAVSRSGS